MILGSLAWCRNRCNRVRWPVHTTHLQAEGAHTAGRSHPTIMVRCVMLFTCWLSLFSLSAIGCRGHSIAFSILKWKRWWKLAQNSASYWDFSDSHRSYAEEKKRQTLAAGAIWGLCSLVLLHTHKNRHTRTCVCSWSHVHTAFRCCLSDTQDVLSSP